MPLGLFLYNAVLCLAAVIAALPVAALCAFSERVRDGVFQRLGIYPGELIAVFSKQPVIWLHAASSGECKCMIPLARKLKAVRPEMNIVFSVTTLNGKKMLEKFAPELHKFYMPLDIMFFISPVVQRIRPVLLVAAETELWPSFFYAVKKQGGKIAVVNGRFSDRKFGRYLFMKKFMRGVLGQVDAFGMRGAEDLERLKQLLPGDNRASVTGDLKFEVFLSDPVSSSWLKNDLAPYLKKHVITAGSVHESEAGELLGAMFVVKKEERDVTFIVAPRFMQENAAIEELFRAACFTTVRRSALKGAKPVDVVLLDTMGELAAAYELCGGAFVGGSLADIGGHNLLEPLYFGRRPFFGKHTENYREIAASLIEAGLGVEASDGAALGRALISELRLKPGHAGSQAAAYIASREGPLNNNIEMLKKVLN